MVSSHASFFFFLISKYRVIRAYRCICPYFPNTLPCLNVCAVSALITHTVGQLCDIFFLSFSLLSAWHLLNLSGVYWCNNWCLHSPTPPLLPGAPHAPTQWIHLHPDYRTNCHGGRKENQILRQQLGEEIAFPLSGRERSPSSLYLRFFFTGEKEAKGEKGKATGLQQLDRKPPAGQDSPISSHLHQLSRHFLSTSLSTHPDTTYQSPGSTGDYIPPSSPPDETEQ